MTEEKAKWEMVNEFPRRTQTYFLFDKNAIKWDYCKNESGTYIRFTGQDYFKESEINGVPNTGIFRTIPDDESFTLLILNNWTDNIWEILAGEEPS